VRRPHSPAAAGRALCRSPRRDNYEASSPQYPARGATIRFVSSPASCLASATGGFDRTEPARRRNRAANRSEPKIQPPNASRKGDAGGSAWPQLIWRDHVVCCELANCPQIFTSGPFNDPANCMSRLIRLLTSDIVIPFHACKLRPTDY
jgi:hypothetical protein